MPDRTCVACRTRRPAEQLVRLSWTAEGLIAPHDGGRGAWVCPAARCVAQLEAKPRALGRALRHPDLGPAAVRGLKDRVASLLMARARTALVRCARAGGVVSGHVAVHAALEGGGIVALIRATDASGLAVEAASALLGPEAVLADLGLDRPGLGQLIQRGPRSVLAVRAGPAGSQLAYELRCRRALG